VGWCRCRVIVTARSAILAWWASYSFVGRASVLVGPSVKQRSCSTSLRSEVASMHWPFCSRLCTLSVAVTHSSSSNVVIRRRDGYVYFRFRECRRRVFSYSALSSATAAVSLHCHVRANTPAAWYWLRWGCQY